MTKKHKLAFENLEFLNTQQARPLRILSEYLEPEQRFEEQNIRHTAIVFGSARTKPDHKHYKACEEFTYNLALLSDEIEKETEELFYICTGGGFGIMEAANKGAHSAGKKTIGLNINLPFEQNCNPYITDELNFEFHYFFMRKLWFLYYAKAVIIFPGGFGTMDEFFETITLVQTKKLEKLDIPILLYDSKFWNGLINFNQLVENGLISPEDLDLFHTFDSTEEGINILKPKLIHSMKSIKNILDRKKQ